MGSLRVLIVDDDERFARALEALLEAHGDFEVVGWASNGAEAVGLVSRCRPDVVTMDVRMPVLDGIEATRAIRAAFPGIRVVALTGSSEPEEVEEALAAGASAQVPKDRAAADLVAALEGLAPGEPPPPPA